MNQDIPKFLTQRTEAPVSPARPSGGRRAPFLSTGMEHAAAVLREGFIQWETASRRGLFQRLDSRVKLFFLIAFVVLVSLKHAISSQAAIAGFLLLPAAASRIDFLTHYRKIVLLAFIFGFLPALPSALNVATPGEIVLELFEFEESRSFAGFSLPRQVGITSEGLNAVGLLSFRVLNSLSVCLLVFATTPFTDFMRALKALRVPDVFLLTLSLSYKYIFLFTTVVYEMHLARKSRRIGSERRADARKWVASRIAFLFSRSRQRCEDVHMAMVARGLHDAVKYRKAPPLTSRDWLAASGVVLFASILYWI